MSLDTVEEDIREQARARAKEIRDSAEQRAQEIIEEAEADATEIRDERLAEADREIEQEREQKVSSAKLEAKQARLEARRELLQSVREQVETQVGAIDGDEREELTRALLDAAAPEFEGEDVQVYGRAEDEPLLTDILEEYDGFEYAGEYDCLGGVVVESTESRIRVKNTFDSVLEDVWEEQLREMSTRLFDQ